MGYDPNCNCPECVAIRNGTHPDFQVASEETTKRMIIENNKKREKILQNRYKNKTNRKRARR